MRSILYVSAVSSVTSRSARPHGRAYLGLLQGEEMCTSVSGSGRQADRCPGTERSAAGKGGHDRAVNPGAVYAEE
jgi:hypothetical protein